MVKNLKGKSFRGVRKNIQMKFLFYLGHPAHFHLFKNTITDFKKNGHRVSILIKKKDILESLLQNYGMAYQNILNEGRRDGRVGIAVGVIKRDWRMLRYCMTNRPDLLIGSSAEIGHVGTLLGIPSINVNEDDVDVISLYSKISYPWSTYILSPRVCCNGRWENKSIKYESYHELAYLHPNNFKASKKVVQKYLDPDEPFFLIRFAKLSAHHDGGIRGVSDEIALKIIELLRPHGKIYISSERSLSEDLIPFRLEIDPLDIHHVMSFAKIYIGDSQTMAAEAGVLGVPFIRFNDFVGRIGYLKELEDTYQLGYGIKPSNPEILFKKIRELLIMTDRGDVFQKRRAKMLNDKIDLAKFMTWFIENYPGSVKIMKENPNYQYNFK